MLICEGLLEQFVRWCACATCNVTWLWIYDDGNMFCIFLLLPESGNRKVVSCCYLQVATLSWLVWWCPCTWSVTYFKVRDVKLIHVLLGYMEFCHEFLPVVVHRLRGSSSSCCPLCISRSIPSWSLSHPSYFNRYSEKQLFLLLPQVDGFKEGLLRMPSIVSASVSELVQARRLRACPGGVV